MVIGNHKEFIEKEFQNVVKAIQKDLAKEGIEFTFQVIEVPTLWQRIKRIFKIKL